MSRWFPAIVLVALAPVAALAQDATLLDKLASKGRYKVLVNALVAADLTEVLKGKGPIAVFAPDDDAFAKVPDEALAKLLAPGNRAELRRLLSYHVVLGTVDFHDLASRPAPTAASGDVLTLASNAHGRAVNDAMVLASEPAGNGTIYRIDKVLTLPADVVSAAKLLGANAFAEALKAAGLDKDVMRRARPDVRPLTVFAPSDQALAAPQVVEELKKGDPAAFFMRHVVPSDLTRPKSDRFNVKGMSGPVFLATASGGKADERRRAPGP